MTARAAESRSQPEAPASDTRRWAEAAAGSARSARELHWARGLLGLVPFVTLSPCLLFLLTSGCGKKPLDPVEVKGRVEYANKKPGTSLLLSFHPQDESNRRHRPTVETHAKDGTFSVQCLPGRFKVTLADLPQGPPAEGGPATAPTDGPSPKTPSSRGKFPDWIKAAGYTDPQQTRWEIEVPEGGTDAVVLVLKR